MDGERKLKKNPITKEQYLEYVKANPFCKRRDIAKHFNISTDLLASHFSKYKLHLRSMRPEVFHGHYKTEIAEFAVNHTLKEIMVHFNENESIKFYMKRHKIPFLKDENLYANYHRENVRDKKCSGNDFEMMFVLSHYFSLASIAAAFNVSREWVRVVCNDFEAGKRILSVKMEGDKNNV